MQLGRPDTGAGTDETTGSCFGQPVSPCIRPHVCRAETQHQPTQAVRKTTPPVPAPSLSFPNPTPTQQSRAVKQRPVALRPCQYSSGSDSMPW
jgi:hypothetical protein